MLEADLERHDAAVMVAVINYSTKRRIAGFMIPAHLMVPSEQYNLDVGLTSSSGNARLYATATLHDSAVGEKRFLLGNPQLTRMEVLLKGCPLAMPLGAAAEESVAVVSVVSDGTAYRERARALSAGTAEGVRRELGSFPLAQFARWSDEGAGGGGGGGDGGGELALPPPSRTQLSIGVGPCEAPV